MNALTVSYDSFLDDPVAGLKAVCGFFGLSTAPDYLQACAAVVRPPKAPGQCRAKFSAGEQSRIAKVVERFDFLRPYLG